MHLWLVVVLCVWLFDVALSAVLNRGRFDLGFYAGRIYGLLAASFVLGVLLIEHALLYAPINRAEGPPRTLSFPSLGAAVIRPPSSPPPARATQAEIDRIKRVLQHLEDSTPDPHVAHLRVALRAGLTPLALANPEALGPNALALIETAALDILGDDLSTLGSSS